MDGETLGEALRRELDEELRLELTGVGSYLLSRRDPGAPFVIHFVEVDTSGEPVSLEHEELAWVLPGELLDLELAPGDRSFVEIWQPDA